MRIGRPKRYHQRTSHSRHRSFVPRAVSIPSKILTRKGISHRNSSNASYWRPLLSDDYDEVWESFTTDDNEEGTKDGSPQIRCSSVTTPVHKPDIHKVLSLTRTCIPSLLDNNGDFSSNLEDAEDPDDNDDCQHVSRNTNEDGYVGRRHCLAMETTTAKPKKTELLKKDGGGRSTDVISFKEEHSILGTTAIRVTNLGGFDSSLGGSGSSGSEEHGDVMSRTPAEEIVTGPEPHRRSLEEAGSMTWKQSAPAIQSLGSELHENIEIGPEEHVRQEYHAADVTEIISAARGTPKLSLLASAGNNARDYVGEASPTGIAELFHTGDTCALVLGEPPLPPIREDSELFVSDWHFGDNSVGKFSSPFGSLTVHDLREATLAENEDASYFVSYNVSRNTSSVIDTVVPLEKDKEPEVCFPAEDDAEKDATEEKGASRQSGENESQDTPKGTSLLISKLYEGNVELAETLVSAQSELEKVNRKLALVTKEGKKNDTETKLKKCVSAEDDAERDATEENGISRPPGENENQHTPKGMSLFLVRLYEENVELAETLALTQAELEKANQKLALATKEGNKHDFQTGICI